MKTGEEMVRKIKVRQAICINNDVRNRTAIGKHRFTGSKTQKGFRIHQILRRRN